MNDLDVISASETGNAVALIDRVVSKDVVFQPGGIETVLREIEAAARAQKVDISTEKGRKACASLMAKIRSSKAALDGMGLELTEKWREATAAVNADRKVAKTRLEKLEDEVGAKLIAWRERETKRVEVHELALSILGAIGQFGGAVPSSEDLKAHSEKLAPYATRDWQEFEDRAVEAYREAVERLHAENEKMAERAREALERAERQKAEREAAAAAQAAREAEIARQAAEQAARDAEARAQQERKAAAEREKAAAERAEADRLAAERRAELAEQREREAAEQAARAREQAAVKAEQDRQAAIEAERQRVAREQEVAAEAERKRAEDKKHRQRIMATALQALISAGVPEEHGRVALVAISLGKIPNVLIRF